jgi:hypothetical protein
MYLIHIKRVITSLAAGGEETRGGKMKGTSIMLLKTNVEKMTEIGLSIMFMKGKDL